MIIDGDNDGGSGGGDGRCCGDGGGGRDNDGGGVAEMTIVATKVAVTMVKVVEVAGEATMMVEVVMLVKLEKMVAVKVLVV